MVLHPDRVMVSSPGNRGLDSTAYRFVLNPARLIDPLAGLGLETPPARSRWSLCSNSYFFDKSASKINTIPTGGKMKRVIIPTSRYRAAMANLPEWS
jgi:hypothetical protein